MQYRNTYYAEGVFDTYWFEKNLQGDIIAVYDAAGTLLIRYNYDAWGNFSTSYYNGGNTSNAIYNPFRYRGYYYDSETGWYYLQSRYYSPDLGRFINADEQLNDGLLGYNMFAYCMNNPVMYWDSDGKEPISIVVGTISLAVMLVLMIPVVYKAADIAVTGIYNDIKAKENEKSEVLVANPTKTSATYYGVRIYNHRMQTLTEAMDYETAIAWAYSSSPAMGINTNWGIYTPMEDDAVQLALGLLPLTPHIEHSADALIRDVATATTYPHFHLPNRIFNYKHKHFHIWYGMIGGT